MAVSCGGPQNGLNTCSLYSLYQSIETVPVSCGGRRRKGAEIGILCSVCGWVGGWLGCVGGGQDHCASIGERKTHMLHQKVFHDGTPSGEQGDTLTANSSYRKQRGVDQS